MKAITFGRYNIVTNAHLHTVKEILKDWDYLTIGIISPEKKKNFIIYIRRNRIHGFLLG